MSQPFTLDHLKHFEAELKSPAQVRLLQVLAMRCAQMSKDGALPAAPEQVRIKLNLLFTAYAIDVYEVAPFVTVTLFGSPLACSLADKERAAKLRVWNCLRLGERFVQFNGPDEPSGRFAMVWFRLGCTFVPAEPPRPENLIEATVGINADFADAMVEYGRALIKAEEAEESGATP